MWLFKTAPNTTNVVTLRMQISGFSAHIETGAQTSAGGNLEFFIELFIIRGTADLAPFRSGRVS